MKLNNSYRSLIPCIVLTIILHSCVTTKIQEGKYHVGDPTGCTPTATSSLILQEDGKCLFYNDDHGYSNNDELTKLQCNWKRNKKTVMLSITDPNYDMNLIVKKSDSKIEFKDFEYPNYSHPEVIFTYKDSVIYNVYNLGKSQIFNTPEEVDLQSISISDSYAIDGLKTTYENPSGNNEFIIYPGGDIYLVNGQAEISIPIKTLNKYK